MNTATRMELEIDLLEKKKAAIESDLRFKILQHNKSMPIDEGMADESVAELIIEQLQRERDRLDVDIAEMKLALYDAVGAAVAPIVGSGPRSTEMVENPPIRAFEFDE